MLPEQAAKLDNQDPLRNFRNQFVINDPSVVYLDGNSLGRLPKSTVRLMEEIVTDQWGNELISSWNKHWYQKSIQLGDKIAKIIGADPGEVIVSDSTSVNLYKLAFAAVTYQKPRRKIISDSFNFPSDLYIFQGLKQAFSESLEIELIRSQDEITISNEQVCSAIDQKTALISLSHVAFKSAFMYDMKYVTGLAHDAGAMALWDLSHSVGAVPIRLNEWNVDMAVGCTYKYLNGGPGAPAFLYVRKDLQEKLHSPIQGWFGAANPFDFSLDFHASPGIRGFLTGTPPVLSLSGIEPGLDVILKAGMENIREKSILQTAYFIDLWREKLLPLGFSLKSPLPTDQRGSHVSIAHPEAFRIVKALIDPSILGYSVVPDFREPDNIRFGIAPLYNSFEEIVLAVQKLAYIMQHRAHEQYSLEKENVT